MAKISKARQRRAERTVYVTCGGCKKPFKADHHLLVQAVECGWKTLYCSMSCRNTTDMDAEKNLVKRLTASRCPVCFGDNPLEGVKLHARIATGQARVLCSRDCSQTEHLTEYKPASVLKWSFVRELPDSFGRLTKMTARTILKGDSETPEVPFQRVGRKPKSAFKYFCNECGVSIIRRLHDPLPLGSRVFCNRKCLGKAWNARLKQKLIETEINRLLNETASQAAG